METEALRRRNSCNAGEEARMNRNTWTAALAATALLAISSGADAQTKLVFSTYLPETYSTTFCDGKFMDAVTKRTEGKVTFERYYASSLLNAVDTLPGVGRGAADMGTSFPGGYNRAQYPISNIVMPFITANPIAATFAVNELYKENKDFQDEYQKQGVHLLYSLVPDNHTIWSREPIRSAADFKGKRIRALLAPGDAIAKMGGTPVAMQWPDGVEAMNRGAIDGFANAPFDLGVKAGLQKVSQYVTDSGGMGTYALSATVVNLRKWKALSPEVQKIMTEEAAKAPDCFFDVVRKDLQAGVDTLAKEKKVELISFSKEESEKLRDTVGKELRQEWIATLAKSGYMDGQKLLDRYLELVSKYEKTTTYKTGFALYREQHGG
jgi:TRAP-type C4-dicarboxylate transport system substrate-binding protein